MAELVAAAVYGNTPTEKTVSSNDTDETLVAAPGAGKQLWIHDIYVRGAGGGTFTLKYTRGGSATSKPIDFGSGGQNGETRIHVAADVNTAITYTADGSANAIDVTINTGIVSSPATL